VTADPFAWTPSLDQIERARATRFMRKHGISDVAELTRRSMDDPAWFWPAVIEDLEISFFEPYEQLVDLSRGTSWARWFVGGRLNLVHHILDRHADGPGAARPAVIWEGEEGVVREWTYAELRSEASRFANALRGLGVGRGDRVGILMPMMPEAVAAFLGVQRMGAIAVPIFSGFGVDAVAARLIDAGAVALISVDGVIRKGHPVWIREVAMAASARSPSVRQVILVDRIEPITDTRTASELLWRELRKGVSTESRCESMSSEDPCLIAYTSGTTGRPKGAVHVHGGFLVKIAEEVAFQVDMCDYDRLFWLTDLGWIMGPWEIVGGLATGGAIVLYDGAPESPGPDRLWQLVERHRVSILGVSPTLIRALLRHGVDPVLRHDLSSLRILASTGEPWNPDPWKWLFDHVGKGRLPIINISGGTEVGACFLSPMPITPLRPCTLGGPALGMAMDVLDSQGRSVAPGAVGELVCRKAWPSMTRGLWNDPSRYEQTYWSAFSDCWTHGDFASIDGDGLWYLHGRSDDTLNVAGKRIGPAELESALVGHPEVAEAAAIGVPDEIKGEVVWCFVVLRPGTRADGRLRDELTARVVDGFGKSFAPAELRFVGEIPRTRNAKILRRAIRDRLLGRDPGDLSNLENPSALDEIEPLSAPR
jgi:acetyl-CoA synthetase